MKIAAEVTDFDAGDFIDKKMSKRMDRYAQYGAAAAVMALEDSGYPIAEDPYAVGALIGSGVGGLDTFLEQTEILLTKGPTRVSPFFIPMMIPNMASGCSSIILGLQGPVNATCTACATGNNALGDAFNIIRRGDATAMFAGGAEAAVNPAGMSGFAALRALSTRNDEPERASRPYDAGRDGFVMGEGAGVLVLEELEHALKRGAHIYGEFAGYGMTGDASHLTEPVETGEPAGKAMLRALADAGLEPSAGGLHQRPRHVHPARRRHGDQRHQVRVGRSRLQDHGQLQQEHVRPLPRRRGRSGGRRYHSFHGSW